MALLQTFRELSVQLVKSRDVLESLRVVAAEDCPTARDSASALVDRLSDDILDAIGFQQEALTLANSAAAALENRPDLYQAQKLLSACRQQVDRLIVVASDLASLETVDLLRQFSRERGGEWQSWSRTVLNSVEDARKQLAALSPALFACWQELAEHLQPVSATAGPSLSVTADALEYSRRLFDNISDWYKNADAKAQVLLALDGAFITFLTTSIFAKHEDTVKLIAGFNSVTWLLLALMAVAVAGSIVSALFCFRSRIYSRRKLREFLDNAGVDTAKTETYAPQAMWFFQMIVQLDEGHYRDRLLSVDKEFEVRVLASQIFELSARVIEKHRWINRGFILAGASLICFLSAAASYLGSLR